MGEQVFLVIGRDGKALEGVPTPALIDRQNSEIWSDAWCKEWPQPDGTIWRQWRVVDRHYPLPEGETLVKVRVERNPAISW